MIVGALVLIGRLAASTGADADCVKGYIPRSSDEAEIVRVENEWCQAAVRRDAARLSAIFADDIVWLKDEGYRTKAQVLHRYMVEIQEHAWELRDVRIRVVDTIGVVSSHVHVPKTTAGRYEESDHTSVEVFQKRDGRWQLVAE